MRRKSSKNEGGSTDVSTCSQEKIEELQKEVASCMKEIDQGEHKREILKMLFNGGFIDKDYNVIL